MDYAKSLAEAIRDDGHVREEGAERFQAIIDGLTGRPAGAVADLTEMRASGELREEAHDRYQAILTEHARWVEAHPDQADEADGNATHADDADQADRPDADQADTDAAAGIEWFNAMSEVERAAALAAANTATPADAWEHHKAQPATGA